MSWSVLASLKTFMSRLHGADNPLKVLKVASVWHFAYVHIPAGYIVSLFVHMHVDLVLTESLNHMSPTFFVLCSTLSHFDQIIQLMQSTAIPYFLMFYC
jgi:hypothetical protein